MLPLNKKFLNTIIGNKPIYVEKQCPEVIFVPDWKEKNPYQKLLAMGIGSSGWKVNFSNYPPKLFPLLSLKHKFPNAKVVHLHWINDLIKSISWSGNSIKLRIRLLLLTIDVLLLRWSGTKVIWTVHNRLSHESANPDSEIMARRALARTVSRLIFHSLPAKKSVEQLLSLTLNKRAVVIPHGNYLDVYPASPVREQDLRLKFNLDDKVTVLLLFGELRRYKGVGILIDAFLKTRNANLRLIIAGKPFDGVIENEINDAAQRDSRIKTYLGFIPESDVGPLHAISDLSIIPFINTLTSGSAILALSQGKGLMLPEEGAVLGLPLTGGIIYFDSASLGLKRALEDIPERDQLRSMGLKNMELAKGLDWSIIGRNIVSVYHDEGGCLSFEKC